MRNFIARLLDREYDLGRIGCLAAMVIAPLIAVLLFVGYFFGLACPPINDRSVLGLYAKRSRDEEKLYISPGGRYTHYFVKNGAAQCVDGGEWSLSSNNGEITLTNWHDSPCYGVNGPVGGYFTTYFEGFWGTITIVTNTDLPEESFLQVE